MGSAFRLRIWSGADYSQVIDWCNSKGIATVCAAATGDLSYTEVNWRAACALILGPESTGLTLEEIAAAKMTVRIPMLGTVESLNVSVAAGFFFMRPRGNVVSRIDVFNSNAELGCRKCFLSSISSQPTDHGVDSR